MVKLTKIYTRGGDKGETSLGTGKRVKKHAPRVAAYGDVDETNAAVGLARLHASVLKDGGKCDAMLARIQNDLFDLGADLCTPYTKPTTRKKAAAGALRIIQKQIDRLEREIDAMNAKLAPLNSFTLPGGTALAAHLHLARTIARRAERTMTALAAKEKINPLAIAYINRLSDHLFVMSRHANSFGQGDVLWVPGANRTA